MKKLCLTLVLCFLTGCSTYSVPLFNGNFNWWGGNPESVVVKKGDTLYSIARSYNVPIREMIEANHLSPPYTLKIGRKLDIPSARYHIVQKGDTLYSIAKRYGVNINSLSKTNNLHPPFSLKIGQKLLLPGSVVDSSTVAQTSKDSTTWFPWKSGNSSPKKPLKQTKKYNTSKKTSKSQTTKVSPRKTKFTWPVKGTVISKFGTIGKGRTNDGINIKAPLGTTVKAADSGTVAYAGNELKGFGNLILIKHNDGWVTAYAHNDRLVVKKGDKVKKGEKIATVGSTGGVNTPQLHFEVRAGKKAVNPQNYL